MRGGDVPAVIETLTSVWYSDSSGTALNDSKLNLCNFTTEDTAADERTEKEVSTEAEIETETIDFDGGVCMEEDEDVNID